MGAKCYLCDQAVDREGKISLHKFPSISEERKDVLSVWVAVCNLDERDKVSTLRLCSRHFRNEDFTCGPRNKKILKVLAVPSIKVPNRKVAIKYNETVTIEERNNAELQKNRRIRVFTRKPFPDMKHMNTIDKDCGEDQKSSDETHSFRCVVPHCPSKNSDNVFFYNFPNDKDCRKRWIHKLKLTEKLKDDTKICSLHFRNQDILPPDADNQSAPRLFNWSEPSVNLSPEPDSNNLDSTSLKLNEIPQKGSESMEDESDEMDDGVQKSTSTMNGHLNNDNISKNAENVPEEPTSDHLNSSAHVASKLPAIASVITKDTFKDMCRCCLINKGEINVFEAHFQNLPFSDLIHFCTTERISQNEGLPKLICNICMQLVVSSYTFIKTVKDSQSHLKELQNLFKNISESNTEEAYMDNDNASVSDINENILKRSTGRNERCFKRKFRKLKGIYTELCGVLEKNRKELKRPEKTKQISLDRSLFKMFSGRGDTKGNKRGIYSSLMKSLSAEEAIVEETESTVEVHSLPTDVMETNFKTIVDSGYDNIDISYNNGQAQVSIVEKKVPELSCFECSEHIPTEAHLIRHSRETGHIIPARFKCKLCSATFNLKRLYRSHLGTHKEESKTICEVCGISVAPRNLSRHLKTHTTKGTYFCVICDREFGHKGSLDLHIRYKHFETDDSLCFICGKTFRNLAMLNKHLNSQHADEDLASRSYSCVKCQKYFATETSLKLHRKCNEDQITGQTKTRKQNNIARRCPICSKSFVGFGLRVHLRYAHREKSYQCTLCSRSFRMAAHLKNHLLKHNAGMPYKCTYCGRTFRFKRYFDNHVRSHTEITTYDCSFCDKTFSHILLMQKHQQSHFTLNGRNDIRKQEIVRPTDLFYTYDDEESDDSS